MPPPKPVQTPEIATQAKRIQKFRDWIAAEPPAPKGEELVLRLTARDASALKRHPEVATHEITFVEGEMRFLGVRVLEGGTADSVLERSA